MRFHVRLPSSSQLPPALPQQLCRAESRPNPGVCVPARAAVPENRQHCPVSYTRSMPAWLGVTITVVGVVFLTWFFLVLLFTPAVDYHVRQHLEASSPGFLHFLQSTCQSQLHHGNRITVFRNGDQFYPDRKSTR